MFSWTNDAAREVDLSGLADVVLVRGSDCCVCHVGLWPEEPRTTVALIVVMHEASVGMGFTS